MQEATGGVSGKDTFCHLGKVANAPLFPVRADNIVKLTELLPIESPGKSVVASGGLLA